MIIDTHVHIGEMLNFIMTEEMVLESMEKYKIDYALVSNIQGTEYDHNLIKLPKESQINQITALKRTIKFARENKEKIGVLHWIKPATEKVSKELEKIIEENLDIIYGLKVHPYHSKMAMDNKLMEPYIKLAEKFNFPIVAHTGGCKEASVIHIYNAAKKHPNVNFVMVHMGLGTDNKEAVSLLKKLPNLYGDTSWVPMETTTKVVKEISSEKILFGSDNPIDGVDTYHNNPKGEKSLYQYYFNDLEKIIGKENYDNVMYRNAIKLFKLHL